MKRLLTAGVLVATFVLLLSQGRSFAQSDTLVVYASGKTLDQVIGGDTTSTGFQKHSVYQLVSLDTTYLFDATITSKSGISVIGVPDPTTGKLPCIQPDVLANGSIPSTLFAFTGQGTRVTLKNLYILGTAINNSYTSGAVAVQVSADSLSLTLYNVVMDQIGSFGVGYAGNWDNFYFSNCKFRNFTIGPTGWYIGEVLRNENYIGAFKTDSIVMKYNTLLCVSGYATAATGGIVNYYEFSHNDFIYSAKNPFFLDRVVNAKFDDNIFYDVYALGQNHRENFGGWDSFTAGTGPGIFMFGLLDSTTAALLLGHASTGPGDPAAEALRKVEVKNNLYYWSKGLTDFWTTWDDSAHVDTVYTPKFMNDTTAYMFNNPTKWPGFVASGNQNVNPGFGASIDSVLAGADTTAFASGLLAYFTAVRTGVGTTQTYGYKITQVPQPEPLNWTPAWPLPEAKDLKYSASLTAPDGKPYGDPYWFTGITAVKQQPAQVPAKFELSNNYPNPFNPSTTIDFTVAQNGPTSLKVYNVLGQLVMTVYQGDAKAHQNYTFNVSLDQFASGVYFYTLQQGSNLLTKKMILLK